MPPESRDIGRRQSGDGTVDQLLFDFLVMIYCVYSGMKPIPYLDLFSGIGGFAWALKEVARPIAYCDNNALCREVITRNMQRGVIPFAPIFTDVCTLKKSHLTHQPTLITAGFPCQDISCMNIKGKGLYGSRSGLVSHVFRLAQSMPSVKFILLENSPLILQRGWSDLQQMLSQTGFKWRQVISTAAQAGAPHGRRRWWCLAYRGNLIPHAVVCKQQCIWRPGVEPCARLLARNPDTAERLRTRKLTGLFGSAIVPAQAIAAWNLLMCGIQPPELPLNCTPLTLVQGTTRISKATWATPVTSPPGSTDQVKTLTDRASRNLSNQLFFDVASGKVSATTHDINIEFVLHLMGYPTDFVQ